MFRKQEFHRFCDLCSSAGETLDLSKIDALVEVKRRFRFRAQGGLWGAILDQIREFLESFFDHLLRSCFLVFSGQFRDSFSSLRWLFFCCARKMRTSRSYRKSQWNSTIFKLRRRARATNTKAKTSRKLARKKLPGGRKIAPFLDSWTRRAALHKLAARTCVRSLRGASGSPTGRNRSTFRPGWAPGRRRDFCALLGQHAERLCFPCPGGT